MTETRAAAPTGAAGANGLLGFLRETLASFNNPRLILPAALLALLLTASNIVILLNMPVAGQAPVAFAAAAFVRLLGLLVLAVAVLRVLADSPRAPFVPDGAFWLYGATLLFGILLGAVLGRLAGSPADPVAGLLVDVAMVVIGAPLAPWFTAIAAARPLAGSPTPWLRRPGRWLPPLILWSLLLVLPLGRLHATIDHFLIRGAGEWFWPLALVDGPLSAILAILGLALAATAYRRVARG